MKFLIECHSRMAHEIKHAKTMPTDSVKHLHECENTHHKMNELYEASNYSLDDFEAEISQHFTLKPELIYGSNFILPDGMFLSPANEHLSTARAMHMDILDDENNQLLSDECRTRLNQMLQNEAIEINSKRDERSVRLYSVDVTLDQWYALYDFVDYCIDKNYPDFELTWENHSGSVNWCRISLASMDTDKIIKEMKMLYRIKTVYQEN